MAESLKPTPENMRLARAFCRDLARSHYENFTVGSFLLPRRLRQHMYHVYAYCRLSDDLADEEKSTEISLSKLDDWQKQLEACYAGDYQHPVFLALGETISTYDIPMDPFANLLKAFRQDQSINRYQSYQDLLGYCQNSADPVGRITLYLFQAGAPDNFPYSDAICTALQLTNFWQDVTVDLKKDRIYIPLDDLARFGCTEDDLREAEASAELRELMAFEVSRAQELFDVGKSLLDRVPRQARLEVSLFIRGGESILEAIGKQNFDVLSKRPTLSKVTKARLVLGALRRNDKNVVSKTSLQEAYKYCQDLTREQARNFYFAFVFLPWMKRRSIYAVYSFCRYSDDLVDDPEVQEPQARLRDWRKRLEAVYEGQVDSEPILVALRDTVIRYDIPKQHFLDLIDGMEKDLTVTRYQTFEELYDYAYNAASVVGLILIEIFGYSNKRTREYAENLGIAMQLTNIIRDVKEDAGRGRIYLPQEDLERFNYSEKDLLAGRYEPAFEALMAFQAERASHYYHKATQLIPAEDRGFLAPAEIMKNIYQHLLTKITRVRYDVFGHRVESSKAIKLIIAFKTWIGIRFAVR